MPNKNKHARNKSNTKLEKITKKRKLSRKVTKDIVISVTSQPKKRSQEHSQKKSLNIIRQESNANPLVSGKIDLDNNQILHQKKANKTKKRPGSRSENRLLIDVIPRVYKWRKLYYERKSRQSIREQTLMECAGQIGWKKKTLDDYFYQIKKAFLSGFSIDEIFSQNIKMSSMRQHNLKIPITRKKKSSKKNVKADYKSSKNKVKDDQKSKPSKKGK